MDLDQLQRAVMDTPWHIRWVAEVDSTNRVLADEVREGRGGDDVLIADFQTAGRGRLGRTWSARPGAGLLMSVSLPPSGSDEWPLGHVTAVSLAAVDACAEVAGVSVNLKWPNDLLVVSGDTERKLGGVLAEAVTLDGVVARIIVGIGLNVAWPDAPGGDTPGVTALEIESEQTPDRWQVAAALLRSLDTWLTRIARDPEGVLSAYRARCCTLGRAVSIELADRIVTGIAVDVDRSGRIVVQQDTGTTVLSVGDVVHLRRQ